MRGDRQEFKRPENFPENYKDTTLPTTLAESYKILQLDPSQIAPDELDQRIRDSHKNQLLLFHPDKKHLFKNPIPERYAGDVGKFLTEKTQQITAARDMVESLEKRNRQAWKERAAGQEEPGYADLSRMWAPTTAREKEIVRLHTIIKEKSAEFANPSRHVEGTSQSQVLADLREQVDKLTVMTDEAYDQMMKDKMTAQEAKEKFRQENEMVNVPAITEARSALVQEFVRLQTKYSLQKNPEGKMILKDSIIPSIHSKEKRVEAASRVDSINSAITQLQALEQKGDEYSKGNAQTILERLSAKTSKIAQENQDVDMTGLKKIHDIEQKLKDAPPYIPKPAAGHGVRR